MGGIVRLDGAGQIKAATLDEAAAQIQRLHGIVEQMAIAQKNSKPTQGYGMQMRRAAAPLVGLLKGQFGFLADQVTAFILVATRGGGSDQMKIRALREQIALLRQAIEIAMNKVKEQHALEEEAETAE